MRTSTIFKLTHDSINFEAVKQKRAIVSVTNDLYTDQRVHKVCTFLKNKGFDVLLVGRKLKNSQPITREYQTHRIPLIFTKGALFYSFYNLRLFLYLSFKKADVLVSNDLDTLLANYLASKTKRNCKLVYDTHEYFTEVPELTSRPRVKRIWESIEAWIFPKLSYIYTVNESIANKYRKKYSVNIKVVRNISLRWKPHNLKTKEALGLPTDKKIIILQGAGINIDRGAEEAVSAMHFIDNAVLLFVGSGDIIEELKKQVQQQNLKEKVQFIGRVPYSEMMNYTYYAHVGLTLDKATNLNYKFSLPNKVFDYIHTTTPIVASNMIEVANIVNTYKVGKVIQNHDPKHIAAKINAILCDDSEAKRLQENCRNTAKILNWESECKTLESIYT